MPAERRGAITGATATTFSAIDLFSNTNNASNNTNTTNNTGNMSFGFTGGSFGSAPAAPAPSGGAFSFGGPTPAPAPGAPGFGGAPSPAPPATFGAPSPATNSLFGAPSTAPSPSLFGAPPPAPGAFGAPAPGAGFGSTSSLFGSTPSGGGFFGNTAPAPSSIFGQQQQQQQYQQQQLPLPALSGNMPYSALAPDMKRAIDTLHEAMMQHKRTVLQVSTMAPKLLQTKPSTTAAGAAHTSQADAAAGGGQDMPLAAVTHRLKGDVHQLQQQMEGLRGMVQQTTTLYEKAVTQAIFNAKWPTEAIAMRRGVHLTRPQNAAATANANSKDLQELLDRNMEHVDRVERMPSPYLWEVLEDMERRLDTLQLNVQSLHKQLDLNSTPKKQRIGYHGGEEEDINVTEIVHLQERAILRLASDLAVIHERVDRVRNSYRIYEKNGNVLELADQAEREHQQKLDYEMRLRMVQDGRNQPPAAPAPGAPATTAFGAPSNSAFGAPAAPAPSTGFFNASAPSTGFGVTSSAPAPPAFGAPSTNIFGAPPTAPAPAPGAAPATPTFGATPAPAFGAPPPSAPTFGAPPAAPAFGGAPPAAPAFGGTPAPTPAGGGFGFAPTPASSTPKSKNKGRSSRRR